MLERFRIRLNQEVLSDQRHHYLRLDRFSAAVCYVERVCILPMPRCANLDPGGLKTDQADYLAGSFEGQTPCGDGASSKPVDVLYRPVP